MNEKEIKYESKFFSSFEVAFDFLKNNPQIDRRGLVIKSNDYANGVDFIYLL